MTAAEASANALRGTAAPSEAGPLEALQPGAPAPPKLAMSSRRQSLAFAFHPRRFMERAQAEAGQVFTMKVIVRKIPFYVTSHPDHVKSLFLAKPNEAPSLTADSPLRPVLGPSTVLTSNGARHMRQRKLLLPSFHGDAINAYVTAIEGAITKELDRWTSGSTIGLADRMSAVTLDVIMSGVFGLDGEPRTGTPEWVLRDRLRKIVGATTKPWFTLVEQPSAGHDSPRFPLSFFTNPGYRAIDDVVSARRAVPETERGDDILSMLLSVTDEDGVALSDYEVRMELLTLLLAGHETTANQLAWTMERMVRNPEPYDRMRESVRGGDEDADAYIDAVIHESMRNRPVIPMVGRLLQRPWRLGDYQVPAESAVLANIISLHHRDDLYPRPDEFLPERFLNAPPGTYEWIPFGGGVRRCLGATLALAEQRVVLREMSRRVDMTFDKPGGERARLRNVTLIPTRGGRVRLTRVTAA
jgi:cytochrome P450